MRNTIEETRIIDIATARFGSRAEALRWYRQEPLPGFSRATAQQLLVQGRARDVLDYIEAVDAGVYA